MKNEKNVNNKSIDKKIEAEKKVTLDEAYGNKFTSKNLGGVCAKCGLKTMYKERTLCFRCYKKNKKR